MRFLHTSDWHLGRAIRGISRQPEFEQVLGEVAAIARDEHVDAVILAGDTFDTFSPPPDAERLLYETLTGLLHDGIKIVMIAGNHDHAQRMDALSGIMRIAGAYCIGSVPRDEGYMPLRLASPPPPLSLVPRPGLLPAHHRLVPAPRACLRTHRQPPRPRPQWHLPPHRRHRVCRAGSVRSPASQQDWGWRRCYPTSGCRAGLETSC